MDFTRHRRAIERMYTDRATIYRHVQQKDPVTKATKFVPQLVYADQPCRISQRGLPANNQSEAQNEIRYEIKLFIAPEVEIKQGDLLEVSRDAVARRYVAGEPWVYSSHQVVTLQRKEWA